MCNTNYTELEKLVRKLEKEFNERKQIQILQEINSLLLTQYEIRISDNEIIHPLRVEAYYYPYNKPGKFDDRFAHPSSKKIEISVNYILLKKNMVIQVLIFACL